MKKISIIFILSAMAALLAASSVFSFSDAEKDMQPVLINYQNKKPPVLWSKTFERTDFNDRSALASLPDGGVIVSIPITEKCISSKKAKRGIWLARISADGKALWSKDVYFTKSINRLFRIRIVDKNKFLIVCDIKGKSTGSFHPWLAMFNFNGAIVWQKSIGENKYNSLILDVEINDRQEIYFGGLKINPLEVLLVKHPWIGQLGLDGNIIWYKNITKAGKGGFTNILPVKNAIFANARLSKTVNYVAAYTYDGEVIWDSTIHTNNRWFGNTLLQNTTNNVSILVADQLKQFKSDNEWDIFLFKYNMHGKRTLTKMIKLQNKNRRNDSLIYIVSAIANNNKEFVVLCNFVDTVNNNTVSSLLIADRMGRMLNEFQIGSRLDTMGSSMCVSDDNRSYILLKHKENQKNTGATLIALKL